jgi:hypothetical protein
LLSRIKLQYTLEDIHTTAKSFIGHLKTKIDENKTKIDENKTKIDENGNAKNFS